MAPCRLTVARAAARVANVTGRDVVSASRPTADRNLVGTEAMGRWIHAAARSRGPGADATRAPRPACDSARPRSATDF